MAKRKRFWSKRLPEEHQNRPWDAIVVGSGMGGMTTAALLAKLGKRVLVLEQHYVPGGFTHTFRRKGYLWDVGVHAVGEMSEKAMAGRVLKGLTDGRLKWASLGESYDQFVFPDGMTIDFPDTPKKFRNNLVAAFPDEEEAIDKYMAGIKEVVRDMAGYWVSRVLPRRLGAMGDKILGRRGRKHLMRTTASFINELTDNPKLRAVFAAQWGYYGATPSQSSWAMQALVVQHFKWGAFYPVGGSAEIAWSLLQTVAEAGGWTRIVADVAEVVVENGKAVGVRMADGEVYRAPQIVSAIGVSATVDRLLPNVHDRWAESLKTLGAGPAHLCLNIGFKGDISKVGCTAANRWFYQTWDMEWSAWDVEKDELGEAMVLYCSFPSLKDPEHDPGPEQRHTGEVVTFVPWEQFERWSGTAWRKRGEDYDALKKRISDELLEQFLAHMPELKDYVDYVELSTPLSTETFVRPKRGSIYGLLPTPERFSNPWLRAKSPIDGLYFSGSEVASVGVVGAMMGGILCGVSMAPWSSLKWLRGVVMK
jgi:all-trans-retinol 13,14-reductase